MHIFLTGDIQVGKSTLIRKALHEVPGIRLGGFRTVTIADVPDAIGAVYILSAAAAENESPGSDQRVGIRYGPGRGPECFPQVFDTRGVQLLRDAEQADLILMDEIGWMESNAAAFRSRVSELLDGTVPILGVVRKMGNAPLQETIRNHPAVRIVTVDVENRNSLAGPLAEWIRNSL